MSTLTDVQALPDTREVPLHRVGVNNVRFPIKWQDREEIQPCLATFSLGVGLPAFQKGAHLSRFLEILQNEHDSLSGLVLSLPQLRSLHAQMLKRLDATEGSIECEFTAFRTEKAPKSQQPSLSYDTIKLCLDGTHHRSITLTLGVTVTSLCPCSKEISNYGAHNQRSLVEVEGHIDSLAEKTFLIKALAKDIAAEGSCEIYNLLKRVDEKAVTEKAYENAKFSEDIVRDVALMIQKKYAAFKIKKISSTHLESIHQHDAFSIYLGE